MKRGRGGFSLLEVMLAAAILGTAVVALLLVLTRSTQQGADADDLRRLQLLGADKLAEMLEAEEASGAGALRSPYEKWRWQYRRTTETWGEESIEMTRHELTLDGPGALTLPPLVRYTADVQEGLDEEPK